MLKTLLKLLFGEKTKQPKLAKFEQMPIVDIPKLTENITLPSFENFDIIQCECCTGIIPKEGHNEVRNDKN